MTSQTIFIAFIMINLLILGGGIYYLSTELQEMAKIRDDQDKQVWDRLLALEKKTEEMFIQERTAVQKALGTITEKTRPSREDSKNEFTNAIATAMKAATAISTDTKEIGSGVFIESSGYLLTNRHVVAGAKKITVKTNDERQHAARLVALAPLDLALLKIDGTFTPLVWGEKPAVGTHVIAIGSPAGLDFTVSEGIVSAHRKIANAPYIQTDISLNQGNSGGPLINAQGELVGINTARIEEFQRLGLAIPAEEARAFATKAMQEDKQAHKKFRVGT